jgi:putative colanic acid biosynthesis UDP-glucose lipid carrier transferase
VLELLDELRDTTASIYYVPDISAFDLIQARTARVGGIPVIAMCESPLFGLGKRLTDIVLAATALLLLSVPIVLISLLIRLSSPGPAIFRQRRYGLDGKEITVYKFRSMTVVEDGREIRQASRDDSRVTTVGALLRRHSLDELPQLFNVLQGRMSLVGPRPHAVAHNESYRGLIKGYMIRHKVLPGITGLAQISGFRGETRELAQMEARVRCDLEYLRSWSMALDFKILALTALRMFRDEQAY